jgi:hypothetical protein
MRYRKFDPRTWKDEKFQVLSDREKLAAIYIFTAQSNRCGLFNFSPAQAAEDLGWEPEIFAEAFKRVLETLTWEWDPTARVLYIPSWWRYNPPENPKHLIGCLTDLHELPATRLLARFFANNHALVAGLRATLDACRDRYPIPIEDVSDTSTIRQPYQELEQELELEQKLNKNQALSTTGQKLEFHSDNGKDIGPKRKPKPQPKGKPEQNQARTETRTPPSAVLTAAPPDLLPRSPDRASGLQRLGDFLDGAARPAGPDLVRRSLTETYAAALDEREAERAIAAIEQAAARPGPPAPPPRRQRVVFPRHKALAAWDLIASKGGWPAALDRDAAARTAFAKVADVPISEVTYAVRERFLSAYELALAPGANGKGD